MPRGQETRTRSFQEACTEWQTGTHPHAPSEGWAEKGVFTPQGTHSHQYLHTIPLNKGQIRQHPAPPLKEAEHMEQHSIPRMTVPKVGTRVTEVLPEVRSKWST